MTFRPCGRILRDSSNGSIACYGLRRFTSLLRRRLFDRDLGVVLQFAADRAVAAGNHFVARTDTALDLNVSVVGDPSRHLDLLSFASILLENDLGDVLAFLALGLLFLLRVYEVSGIVALVSELLYLFAPFDLLRA